MPALDAGIHVLRATRKKDVDARHKAGHDERRKLVGAAHALAASRRFFIFGGDAFRGAGAAAFGTM
jgi:hypothetical protein